MRTQTYLAFIWKKEANREYLLYGLVICIVQFVVFKILYPYPDFYNDSLWYIWAASANMDISVWPIGYSKFLSAFHALTVSDTALTVFQYFFMQLVLLNFYFTIIYFFKTGRWTRNVLFFFLLINPLTLYLANTVISDSLFGALTLLWLTQLIWLLQRPYVVQIFTQAILVFLCFSIRHTACYYPFISSVAFVLSRQSVWKKLSGILLSFLFPFLFIQYSKNAAYEFIGYRQSSLFTGWQLANNALYIYEYLPEDSMLFTTPETRELDRMARSFFRGKYFLKNRSSIYQFPGSYFVAQGEGPLKQYFFLHSRGLIAIDKVRDWGKMSTIFELYGRSIIMNHPLAYIRYFGAANARFFFLPPLADMQVYNGGQNKIYPIAREWFAYTSTEIDCLAPGIQRYLMVYSSLFLLFNIYFWGQLVFVGLRTGIKSLLKANHCSYFILLAYLLINFLFSLFAAINVLRYQYIPMVILLCAGFLISNNFCTDLTAAPCPARSTAEERDNNQG